MNLQEAKESSKPPNKLNSQPALRRFSIPWKRTWNSEPFSCRRILPWWTSCLPSTWMESLRNFWRQKPLLMSIVGTDSLNLK